MSWRSYSDSSLGSLSPRGSNSPQRDELVLPFRERRITQGLFQVPLEEMEFDINADSVQGFHSSVGLSELSPDLDSGPAVPPLGLHRASDSEFSELSGSDMGFVSDESTPSHSSPMGRFSPADDRTSPQQETFGQIEPSPAIPMSTGRESFQAPRSDPRGSYPSPGSSGLSLVPPMSSPSRAPLTSPRRASGAASLRTLVGPSSPPRAGMSSPRDGWKSRAPSISKMAALSVSAGAVERKVKLTKGWLTKRGGTVRSWKKRWFVLSEKHLRYFADRKERDMRGIIDLSIISDVKATSGPLEFSLATPKRTFLLRAEKETARASWVERITTNVAACAAKASAGGPVVSLQKKDLKTLPKKHLPEVEKATAVRLSSNKFAEVPQALYNSQTVKLIDLSRNFLTKLDSDISLLSGLRELDLNNNLITALPTEIGMLTNLRVLRVGSKQDLHTITDTRNMHKNQLTELPTQIGLLTELQELSLARNELKDLPAEMRYLTKLTILDLSENKLTVCPYWIQFYRCLRLLDLQSNRLVALPSTISKLHFLEVLNVSGNEKLPSLPLTVSLLKRLVKLTFDENLPIPASLSSRVANKRTNLVPELKMFSNTTFKPNIWRMCAFGRPQAGKTSLVAALLRHGKSATRKATTRSANISPNSSLSSLASSPPSSSPLALSSAIGNIYVTHEWQPKDAPGVTFLVQDMDRVIYDNFLHHLVAPRSIRSVQLYVYRANEPLEPQQIGPALELLKREYARTIIVLVGTVAPGDSIPEIQQRNADTIAALATEFQCPSFVVDPSDSKTVKDLAGYISNMAAQRQQMSVEELPARYLVMRNAIQLDLFYFAATPFLIWSSWVNYLRHCGCQSMEEVSAATEYLTDIGDIVPLQSEQSNWIVFSVDWALHVSLWPSFSIWLSQPIEYTNALEQDLTEEWDRMDPAFRYCMSEALRKELKRVRKYPC